MATPVHPKYEELKTELQICEIGGLFLAIYEDEKTPEQIISCFQEEMPEYFHFPLYMTDEKIVFPIFFDQTFEQVGKQSDIFHVLNIESLSEDAQKQFINSLQYGREKLKALPYSIVFWIKPSFVKKLFHAAPDFHHWIFGTYDFTAYHDNNNNCSYQEKEKVFLRNIDEYLKKLIWEYEHWQKVKNSGKDFLLEVMGRANLAEYYVQMFCKDKQGDIRLLDEVLQEFLADNQQSFMTMLGDFGTGKSSFSMYYFILQAREYLSNKSRWIPLFISLKDYQKKLDIQTFIKKEFAEKFNLSFSLAVFQNLMLQGKFLLFVDGFDEMASISSEKETIQNFKELNKLSFEHLQFMTLCKKNLKNKLFMTCRTHYFFTEDQEKDILTRDYPGLYRNYVTKSRYQITRVYVQEFNDEQIEKYISKNTKDETSIQEILNIINDTYNLKELANRPLLLEMIVKTLPSLKDKQEINAADLYQAYTSDWIERDDWRSQMTPQGKRNFMWELGLKMYQKGGDFSLHYSELDTPKNEYFKSGQKNEDDAYFIYETTTCSFLNRAPDGKYKFIHKSFMEFFIAELFFNCVLYKKTKLIGYYITNDEIKFFLNMFFRINKYKYLNLSIMNLRKGKFIRANLEEANLEEANLEEANLEEANLEGANLSGANLSGANLYRANLEGANLYLANLERANLRRANLCRIKIEGANLYLAKLEGANLRNATLFRVNLEKANLRDAILEESTLQLATLQFVNLKGANLSGANLYRANLEGANLEGANLKGANLEGANLKGVKGLPKIYDI